MLFLVAHLQKTEDSCWGVSVPALGGCFGAGDTIPEAIKNITSAIAAHLELMQEEHELICFDTEEATYLYELNKLTKDDDGTSHYYTPVPIKLSCNTDVTLLK